MLHVKLEIITVLTFVIHIRIKAPKLSGGGCASLLKLLLTRDIKHIKYYKNLLTYAYEYSMIFSI